jgi:ribosomal protein S18 acetylase RimI-like enzyme
MNAQFRPLSVHDIPTLLLLMREFYPQQGMPLDEKAAVSAAETLVKDPHWGEIHLISTDRNLAGYFVLTICFSLEFHGRFALLDEIYLRQPFRHQGLGHAAVAFAEEICKARGIKAIRLEVGQENASAQRFYRVAGYKQEPRFLFTKWL